MSHCFVDRTGVVESTEVNATIDFDGEGRADKVTIADLRGLLTAGEHDCLRQALRALRTPCPGGARATGTARIAWRISDD